MSTSDTRDEKEGVTPYAYRQIRLILPEDKCETFASRLINTLASKDHAYYAERGLVLSISKDSRAEDWEPQSSRHSMGASWLYTVSFAAFVVDWPGPEYAYLPPVPDDVTAVSFELTPLDDIDLPGSIVVIKIVHSGIPEVIREILETVQELWPESQTGIERSGVLDVLELAVPGGGWLPEGEQRRLTLPTPGIQTIEAETNGTAAAQPYVPVVHDVQQESALTVSADSESDTLPPELKPIGAKYGSNRDLTIAQVKVLVSQCRKFMDVGGTVREFYDLKRIDDRATGYFSLETFRKWLKNPKFTPEDAL